MAKVLSKIDVFRVGFRMAGAAGGAASGVLSAADAPGERHFIKDYSIITHQNTICTLEILEIAASLTCRWAVGPANFGISLGSFRD